MSNFRTSKNDSNLKRILCAFLNSAIRDGYIPEIEKINSIMISPLYNINNGVYIKLRITERMETGFLKNYDIDFLAEVLLEKVYGANIKNVSYLCREILMENKDKN